MKRDEAIYDEETIKEWKKEKMKTREKFNFIWSFFPLIAMMIMIVYDFLNMHYFRIFIWIIFSIILVLWSIYSYGEYKEDIMFLKVYQNEIKIPVRKKWWSPKQKVIDIKDIKEVKLNINEKDSRKLDRIIIFSKNNKVLSEIDKRKLYSIQDFKLALKKAGVEVIE